MARKKIAHVGPFASVRDAEQAASALAENRVKGVIEEVIELLYVKPGCTRRQGWVIRISADDVNRARRIVAVPVG